MKKDPRIDQYIKDAPEFSRPILKHLRKMVHSTCADARETIKWGKPWYLYLDKVMCGTVAFKAHLAFIINKKSLIVDRKGQPAKAVLNSFKKITSVDDLPTDRDLKFYIQQAMKLNEPGAKKVQRKVRAPKPPAQLPRELSLALKAVPKGLASYQALTESVRRHYVEWINDAKTDTTREKRLEKAVDCILAGKQRHWK